MDRGPLLRKAGLVVAGLVVLGVAVIALRSPDTGGGGQVPPRPPQTSVAKYAADGIILPEPGPKPGMPGQLKVVPGSHRLQVYWAKPEVAQDEPFGAAGFEVRWGPHGTAPTALRLVAEPLAELDGLTDGMAYDVEVRTVDSFGQRSAPARTSARPGRQPDPTAFTFVDHFDGPAVPDPTNWRFASPGFCAKATKGEAPDDKRLTISANCGAASVALRARAPFKLTDGDVRGSVVVDTDSPGEAGELLVDLVPGPVDLIDGSPSGSPKPDKAGVAQQDPALPPGTIRVRIAASPADRAQPTARTTVQVIAAPDVARNGHRVAVKPIPQPRIGLSVRWQVVLRKDRVEVLRDGVVVGGGDVTAKWDQATALIGFVGPSGGFRAGVAMVGFTGAPTAPPVNVPSPQVQAGRTVEPTTMIMAPAPAGELLTGVQAGQLRLSLLPQSKPSVTSLDGTLTVDIGGKRVRATPAVKNQPLARGVRYPIVALVPAEALLLSGDHNALVVTVSSNTQQQGLATRVEFGDIELFPKPGTVPTKPAPSTEDPLPKPHPAVARATANLLGATGAPIPDGAKVVPGRVILDVALDGPAAQRIAGELAGLGGIEIRLDGKKIAGVPTTVDGPGAGGHWRFPLTTNQMSPGPHIIEVRAVGVDAETLYASTIVSFTV